MAEAAGLYFDINGPEQAPWLILSSGLGGSGGYWAPNLPALSQRFRVLTYDQRGTGRSDRTLPDVVSVEDMAADVQALMDALGIARAHFIGHALGGAIGMELAIATDRLDSLVVINGWRELSAHTRRCFAARLALLHGAGVRPFLDAQPLFLFPPDWIAQNDARITAEIEHHLAGFPGVETMAGRIAAVQAYSPELLDLTATPRLLAIATRDDFLVPYASALDVFAPVEWAQTATFDWGGHACNVTDQARFDRVVLEFLS